MSDTNDGSAKSLSVLMVLWPRFLKTVIIVNMHHELTAFWFKKNYVIVFSV